MADEDIKVVGLSSSNNKGKSNWKIIGAVIGIVVLVLGIIAGIFLVRQQQDLREQAKVVSCSTAGAEQCPMTNDPRHLLNCHPPQSNGAPADSVCNIAGRIEFCGTKNFCCPKAGGAWTPDMTKCANIATPTAPSMSGTMSCGDNFSESFDSSIDTNIWNKYGDATISSGQLVVNVASGQATGSGISNKKYLTGDFIITFDEPSLTKTGTGSVAGALMLSTSDQSKIITVGRNIKTEVHNVGANFAPSNQTKVLPINATDNVSFKVERKAGKITASYKLSTALTYTEIIAFTSVATEDLKVDLVVISIGNPVPATTAKFDNFVISCSAITATATATSTGQGTATATATSTSASRTATATATATATSHSSGSSSSGSATSAPIPVTGANWPTIIGAGFGVIMILASMALAL